MEKRHMDIIVQRAEEFAETGVTRLKRWELKSWFGAERLGKNVWRNIGEHLSEKRPGASIQVIEIDNEFIMVDRAMIANLDSWS
jgi:hypothetical protein